MRNKFLLWAVVPFCLVRAQAAESPLLVHVLEQLRACRNGSAPMLGGPHVGYAGRPHEFYLLFPYFSQLATKEDLTAMLHDRNPVVRLMAVKCVVASKRMDELRPLLQPLRDDQTRIDVGDGCTFEMTTVAAVMHKLEKNPGYLGPEKAPGGG